MTQKFTINWELKPWAASQNPSGSWEININVTKINSINIVSLMEFRIKRKKRRQKHPRGKKKLLNPDYFIFPKTTSLQPLNTNVWLKMSRTSWLKTNEWQETYYFESSEQDALKISQFIRKTKLPGKVLLELPTSDRDFCKPIFWKGV